MAFWEIDGLKAGTPEFFGYSDSNSNAANLAALQAWASAEGVEKVVPPREYIASGPLTFSQDKVRGTIGKSRITSVAGGVYTQSRIGGGSATDILAYFPGSITNFGLATGAISDKTITLLTTPTAGAIVPGDILFIVDQISSSWFGEAAGQKNGEAVVVQSIAGPVITLMAPVKLVYASGTTVHKIKGAIDVAGVDFVVHDPTLAMYGWFAEGLDRGRIDHVRSVGGYVGCGIIDRSARVEINAPIAEGFHFTTTLDYGVVIASCAHITVNGGHCFGGRHGTATGGFQIAASIVNHDIVLRDMWIGHPDQIGSFGGADMHVDIRNSVYERCNLQSAKIGGQDNDLIDCVFYNSANDKRALYLTRLRGGSINIIRPRFYVLSDPNGSANSGLIDAQSSAVTEWTKGPVAVNIVDMEVRVAPGVTVGQFFMWARNQSTTSGKPFNVRIDGVDAAGAWTRLLHYQLDAGASQPDFIQVTRVRKLAAGASAYVYQGTVTPVKEIFD
ncbi:phage tailspike polysaccharide lyase family protein [Pseudaminobacter sp. NGMCC 1.201702]|uniref:phage tailspike polysaccharide lyase family protein n=1 Tax=Pseudaminobacter sp. NGMCC 1.201702 TaxID=3391825 RepID=UPI0039EECED8